MRDALIVLLILAVAVGWFSAYGPREAVDGRGLGPGDDRMGESPLVISGPGAGIVTGTTAPQAEKTTLPAQHREENQTGQNPEEAEDMDEYTGLIWYAAGAAAILIGAFSGPLVAAFWRKIKEE